MKILLGVFFIVLALKIFLISFYHIPSRSMEETLLKGDMIIVNKLAYSLFDIEKEDIIAFEKENEDFIKRIKFVAGEEISFKGRKYKLPKLGDEVKIGIENIEFFQLAIQQEGNDVYVKNNIIFINDLPANQYKFKYDTYFVCGDNKSNSIDSRFYGAISENSIIGKSEFIYWSKSSDEIRYNRILKSIE